MMVAHGRVTVVNDSAEVMELFTELLTDRQPFEVAQLSGEDTSVEEIAASAPDLIILDLRLETSSNGWDLLRELRERNGMAGVPVILCTGDLQGMRDRAGELDSISDVHVLEKPFNLEAFESLVERIVRRPETASS